MKERKTSLIAWNPWAMESPGRMRRDYVFEYLRVCRRYKQVLLLSKYEAL
jgi:hypothetical protein